MRFSLLKKRSLISLVASLLFVGSAGLIDGADDPAKARADRVIAQLVEAHNKERAKDGLVPLTLESHLTEAAKVHAKDMAEHDVMTHDGSDGSNSAERVAKAGYHYLSTGENVAQGYRTVPEVMKAWMDSPPHKKNILADYSEIGLAVVYSETGKPYWCAEFGKPFPKFEPATASGDLVKKINEERTAAKTQPMTIDTKLARAAQDQADKLASGKVKSGGEEVLKAAEVKSFRDLAVSTSSGNPDAETMIQMLMANSDQKAQILGKYARIGTGYATSEDGTPHWCIILANPGRR